MIKNGTIQIKVFTLLAIFGLNLLLSFVCAIGLNRGLFANHHAEIKVTAANEHPERVEPHHDKDPLPATKDKNRGDNCCIDEAGMFTHIEKSLPQKNIELLKTLPKYFKFIDIFM